MKKIIVLMLVIFMGFSINGFSQDGNHKKIQSAITLQPQKRKAITRHKQRKPVPRKRTHKTELQKHSPKKPDKAIRL